jgi:hypothetical protein
MKLFDCKVFIPPVDEHFEIVRGHRAKKWDEK